MIIYTFYVRFRAFEILLEHVAKECMLSTLLPIKMNPESNTIIGQLGLAWFTQL